MNIEEETDDGRWLVPKDAALDRAQKRTSLTPAQQKIEKEWSSVKIPEAQPVTQLSNQSATVKVVKNNGDITLIAGAAEIVIKNEKLVAALIQNLKWDNVDDGTKRIVIE